VSVPIDLWPPPTLDPRHRGLAAGAVPGTRDGGHPGQHARQLAAKRRRGVCCAAWG